MSSEKRAVVVGNVTDVIAEAGIKVDLFSGVDVRVRAWTLTWVKGPSQVCSFRFRRCSYPLLLRSTVFIKESLTANATPCSLHSSVLVPCQENA